MVSKHLQLVFAWIGYLNARDLDNMAKVMNDNFVQLTRPASVGSVGALAGKQEYLQRFLDAPIKSINVSFECVYASHKYSDPTLQRCRCPHLTRSSKPKM